MTTPSTDTRDTQAPRLYQGRVTGINDVLVDTRVFTVELDHHQRLEFRAGQYAMVSLAGLPARPFSIASTPGKPLEFHIRNTGRGDGARALAELKAGDAVTLEAPLGAGYWRPSERPVLALAGDIGITPIKAVLEAHLADPAHAPARLYWGAHSEERLYLDTHFRALTGQHAKFSYIPVLSGQESPRHRTGLILPHLLEDFPTLDGLSIYVTGPTAMMESLIPGLLQHGADPAFIFGDAVKIPQKNDAALAKPAGK